MTARADEFHRVNDSTFTWSCYEPSIKCEWGATALKMNSGLVVIDPVPLADEAWAELLAIAPLRAILLTSGNHARETEHLRQRHSVPVGSAPGARKELAPLKPDLIFLETELLYGITPVPLAGGAPGETAFLAPNGVVVLGDAVVAMDPEQGGLQILPDKYCEDPKQLRASLQKLAALDFHTLTFAHGLPVVGQAKAKLQALLDPP
jgi:glyoxylase-like metal-dependent hydrolase (beta-lactamase superfamily II)